MGQDDEELSRHRQAEVLYRIMDMQTMLSTVSPNKNMVSDLLLSGITKPRDADFSLEVLEKLARKVIASQKKTNWDKPKAADAFDRIVFNKFFPLHELYDKKYGMQETPPSNEPEIFLPPPMPDTTEKFPDTQPQMEQEVFPDTQPQMEQEVFPNQEPVMQTEVFPDMQQKPEVIMSDPAKGGEIEYLYHNSSQRHLEGIANEGIRKDLAGEYPHGIKDISDEKLRIYLAEDKNRALSFGGMTNSKYPETRSMLMRVKPSALKGDVYKPTNLGKGGGGETWFFGDKIDPKDIEVRVGDNEWIPIRDYAKQQGIKLSPKEGITPAIKNLKSKEIIVYHVAPRRSRESILKHGLDPSKAQYAISSSGKESYVFKDLDEAKWYKNYQEQNPADNIYEKFDIYEVKVDSKKLKADYGLTSDIDAKTTSHSIKTPIKNVRLLKGGVE